MDMTLEGKKSSSLRRWKEQKRAHHTSCLSTPAVLWAILVVAFFLTRRAPVPPHHPSSVIWERYSNDTISHSSFLGGSSRKWHSAHGEVLTEERNWEWEKRSKRDHPSENRATRRNVQAEEDNPRQLYKRLKSSSTLGFSSPLVGTERSPAIGNAPRITSEKEYWEPALDSEETPDVSKVQPAEEDEDGIRLLRQGTNAAEEAEEDQEQAQLEEVVTTEDSSGVSSSQARNATVEDLWVAPGLTQKASKPCAEVEKMGSAAAGDTRKASLRLRGAIRSYFAEHGAQRVRRLPPHLFCERSFVLGMGKDDGFGNNMYKLLTAAALGMILNRSVIIGESSSTNVAYIGNNDTPLRFPFGNYISYSDQAFSMREVKQLWVDNNCSGQYNRALVLKVDPFDSPAHSTVLCEDWTKWTYPIVWFQDTQDTVALQFLLKNQHANVRSAAALVLGDPSQPDSRPNTFGELMMAVVEPKPEVREAVDWALRRGWDSDRGPWPKSSDIALHLRMRHSSSKSAPEAASACIMRIISELAMTAQKRPRIVVVSDTPSAVAFIKRSSLARSADIISFDYKEFLSSSSRSSEFSLRADAFLPPSKRKKDWGPLPRWVAVVDFFLAARAKHAVVSGAHRRVGTTFAQLVASLAAAYTLEEEADAEQQQPARSYSSFQELLLVQGLLSQGGWGHSWRPFGGKLSCPKQPPQCAITPLLPYAWWDAPWQSPSNRDRDKMRRWGIVVKSDGEVTHESLEGFCRKRKKSSADPILLALPKAKS